MPVSNQNTRLTMLERRETAQAARRRHPGHFFTQRHCRHRRYYSIGRKLQDLELQKEHSLQLNRLQSPQPGRARNIHEGRREVQPFHASRTRELMCRPPLEFGKSKPRANGSFRTKPFNSLPRTKLMCSHVSVSLKT